MIHLLTYNKDENIQTALMIMNFAKAFDKVPHKRTVYKFKYYEYMPPPLPYFKVNICPFPLPHFASIYLVYL
jgi:hypothetical protein